VERGGMFCSSCAGTVHGIRVLDSTRYALQYIVSSTVQKLFSFAVSEAVREELCRIAAEYTAYYCRHTFKSLQIMEDVVEIK
jgi:DNA repair protein RecO (recombination protein O)